MINIHPVIQKLSTSLYEGLGSRALVRVTLTERAFRVLCEQNSSFMFKQNTVTLPAVDEFEFTDAQGYKVRIGYEKDA